MALEIKLNGDIELTRGDSAHLAVKITEPDGTEYQFAVGDTLKLTVKRDAESEVLIERTSTDTQIDLLPEDTKPLDFGIYAYDVELTTASGEVYTVVPYKRFIVGKEVG